VNQNATEPTITSFFVRADDGVQPHQVTRWDKTPVESIDRGADVRLDFLSPIGRFVGIHPTTGIAWVCYELGGFEALCRTFDAETGGEE